MSVRRHTGYNLLGALIPIILSLVTVPLYLELVGAERYGVLAIAWLLLGYFGLFDLGLGRATSFRISALRSAPAATRSSTFLSALAVNAAMGVAGGLTLWAAAAYFFSHVFKVDEHLRGEILAAVPLLAASVPVATLMGVLTGAMQGREKFLEINVISVISTTLFQLVPLALAWRLGPNLSLLLGGALAARGFALVAMGYRCHAELIRGSKGRVDKGEVVALLKYGGWVSLTSALGPLLYIADRFVIGALLGAAAVTNYTVPLQLAGRTAILPSALTTALFPRLSAASPDEQRELTDRATLTLASLLSLPFLGGVFLIGPFLNLWVGDKIAPQADLVGRIILVGMWANAFALISFTRLQAAGRPDLVTKVMLLEIPPYFLVMYLGIIWFGLPGAAFAVAARSLADYALLTWFAGRRLPGWRTQAVNLALLILGVWLASIWRITDWQWWLAALILGMGTLAIAAYSLPGELREELIRRLRAALRRPDLGTGP
ncbi:flippase [Phenylobacterium sp.]|uniref:flippase n=1 Tax=Phenylobacterium sp. TaxID=1871053 RepID=UPI00272FE574|nr:flippase [Phenylobacterium sp.]MDP1598229.1 flippase [Phenylobacterium sp.]MDP3594707.1 flippase [Phenylobacterium sp.]